MNRFFITVYLLIFMISCKSETKKLDSNHDSSNEAISIIDTLSIKLNVDEKWIANLETEEGVLKMDSIISAFKSGNQTTYKTLGNNLSKQTSYIIKHCSMKGEPHDQLHVVLVPMLDEISILKEEEDEQKAKAALHNLEQLIDAYFKFFKIN